MSVRRVAMLSVHTSPLAQPGAGDGGGMNVYVGSLASALARAGVECDVLTRADHPGQRPIVEVEPGYRVVHLDVGPTAPVGKRALLEMVDDLVGAAGVHLAAAAEPFDALHSHYWISGVVGHRLKHELDVPLVGTVHTLARTKAAAGINDDPELMRRTGEWLAAIDPAMRVKIIGFRRHGVRPHDPELVEPTHESLEAAAALLWESGSFDICVV